MDYNKAADVVATMVDTAQKKLALEPRDLLIRGALSGALLGAATTLAFTGAGSTGDTTGTTGTTGTEETDTTSH